MQKISPVQTGPDPTILPNKGNEGGAEGAMDVGMSIFW